MKRLIFSLVVGCASLAGMPVAEACDCQQKQAPCDCGGGAQSCVCPGMGTQEQPTAKAPPKKAKPKRRDQASR